MKRKIFLFIFFFSAGFFTHALLFPDFMVNGFTDVSKIVLPEPTPTGTQKLDPLVTEITYDGKRFSKHNVNISYTRYIQIINKSETNRMWLQSNKPELNTSRSYGYSEAVKAQFNEKGTFLVVDKNNPSEKLVITVK